MSLKDMKTTKWSITHWLTEGRTLESLQQLVQNMPNDWAIEGQIEQGKIDDKLHGQLFLKTPQTRGTRIAKFFRTPTLRKLVISLLYKIMFIKKRQGLENSKP